MSTFTCPIVSLEIVPHPDADALELAKVGGYVAVTQMGRFKTGDLAVYVPEDAVVPEDVLKASGFWNEDTGKGYLAGSKGNRVKAIRLRGVLSQGILIDMDTYAGIVFDREGPESVGAPEDWEVGHDVASFLGIEKYVPPVPVHLAGDVKPCPGPLHAYTDIENLKKYPDVLTPGEEVIATEKAHGSCMIVLYHEGEFYVSSKGFASKRLYLDDLKDEQGNSRNAYWRAFYAAKLDEKLRSFARDAEATTIHLFGEILGVQDLKYGMENGDVRFVAFDIQVDGEDYMDYSAFAGLCYTYRIPQVPELYKGPFTEEAIAEVTDGRESFTGVTSHVREGVVIRPVRERRDLTLGRVILKSVSADYLTRKNGTDWV
jgi:RNA ligase (TIGR02306 family)